MHPIQDLATTFEKVTAGINGLSAATLGFDCMQADEHRSLAKQTELTQQLKTASRLALSVIILINASLLPFTLFVEARHKNDFSPPSALSSGASKRENFVSACSGEHTWPIRTRLVDLPNRGFLLKPNTVVNAVARLVAVTFFHKTEYKRSKARELTMNNNNQGISLTQGPESPESLFRS